MVRFDGNTSEDVKLWHTYLYWARQKAETGSSVDQTAKLAIVDDPNNRVDPALSSALQTIVFSSFALEYRLKRVLLSMGVSLPPKKTLLPLLQQFWKCLSNIDRLDGQGKCTPPNGWKACIRELEALVKLRNNIAHADYDKTLAYFGSKSDAQAVACQYYNAVVEALRLINLGTGYETPPITEVEEYFKPLRV
jgi:hypothetical protein